MRIAPERWRELNEFLVDPANAVLGRVVELVERFGGPDAINRKHVAARRLPNLLRRLEDEQSPYRADLDWLAARKAEGAFVPLAEYRARVLGTAAVRARVTRRSAVTLEISALQFFPWLIAESRRAIERRELMPGRYIRVRCMKEQAADQGDLPAVVAATQLLGASCVETLDTKGTDGSNVHLGGPATITGYFGGVGQPNDHALAWAEEFLHYYTEYGVSQALNVNAGTILVAYLLYKLGVDATFKISVFMGNDNPYSVLWTLLAARLFARPDGSTPLAGFNFANSVNNETIRLASDVRRALGLEKAVRFEHHIVETWKSIVVQPYDRLDELVELAADVPNISAKHEGGVPAVEKDLAHPSDILDYFLPKAEIERQGLMPALERNYLEKHAAVNRTAEALTRAGIAVVAAAVHGGR
ncbi:MAG: hypothetical protein HY905_22345 [Deltaproteobacteria bacterium]|nr:hypothetical protein [Deltaproteobacteria bacterium]